MPRSSRAGLGQVLWRAGIPLKPLVIALALALLETGISLWVPVLTRDGINSFGQAGVSTKFALMLALALLLQSLAGGVAFYLLGRCGHGVVARVRQGLLARMLRLPVSFYDGQDSGALTSRLVSDTACLKSIIGDHLVPFLSGLTMVVGSVVILWFLDWKMTLVLFSTVLLAFAVIVPIATKLNEISKHCQDETAGFSGRLTGVWSEIRLVKAQVAESEEQRKGESAINRLLGLGVEEARIQAIMSPVLSLAIMGALVVILGYGGARVQAQELSPGSLIAFMLYLFNIVLPLTQFSMFFAEYQKASGAAERIIALTEMSLESDESESAKLVVGEGNLQLENLSFGYKDGEETLQIEALKIPGSRVTALVGPSGSGKTTVLSLLLRFYQTDAGRILLDGKEIGEIPLPDWRRAIGYVCQGSAMLGGTIRENLVLGLSAPVSDEQLRQAAADANALSFIEALPQGFDTLVGERGVGLSGGELQRLAIARAFLKDPAILLLDEATSNLDGHSEQAVTKALARLVEGRTTIVVAHRLSTVRNADQIVVLEGGRVSGVGDHKQLLEHHPGYGDLVRAQMSSQEAGLTVCSA